MCRAAGPNERGVWIVIAACGAVLYAAIFGTVTATLQKLDSVQSGLTDELQAPPVPLTPLFVGLIPLLKEVVSFCSSNKLPFLFLQ